MNREEIERGAYTYAHYNFERSNRKLTAKKDFREGAKWMQERYKALDVHTDNSEVIATLLKEKVELERKVSELTEALDASTTFCEGVREILSEVRNKVTEAMSVPFPNALDKIIELDDYLRMRGVAEMETT